VTSVEISRTLVKSPPELWSELQGDRLTEAVDGRITESSEPERTLAWAGRGASGTVRLESSSWGTKVTLTAEIEEQEPQGVAVHGRVRIQGGRLLHRRQRQGGLPLADLAEAALVGVLRLQPPHLADVAGRASADERGEGQQQPKPPLH